MQNIIDAYHLPYLATRHGDNQLPPEPARSMDYQQAFFVLAHIQTSHEIPNRGRLDLILLGDRAVRAWFPLGGDSATPSAPRPRH